MKYQYLNGLYVPLGHDYALINDRRLVQGILRKVDNQILASDEKRRYEAYRRLNNVTKNEAQL